MTCFSYHCRGHNLLSFQGGKQLFVSTLNTITKTLDPKQPAALVPRSLLQVPDTSNWELRVPTGLAIITGLGNQAAVVVLLPGNSASALAAGSLRASHLLWPLHFCAVCCWLWGRVSGWPLRLTISRDEAPSSSVWSPPRGLASAHPPRAASAHDFLARLPTPTCTSNFLRFGPSQNISAFSHILSCLWLQVARTRAFSLCPHSASLSKACLHTWLPCLSDKQAQVSSTLKKVSSTLKKVSLIPISSSDHHFFPLSTPHYHTGLQLVTTALQPLRLAGPSPPQVLLGSPMSPTATPLPSCSPVLDLLAGPHTAGPGLPLDTRIYCVASSNFGL